MRTLKYKHLSFEDRCAIQEYLNLGYNFTQIGKVLKKHRTTIAKEVYNHRFLRRVYGNKEELCFITKKAPYVCNACKKFNHCKKIRYSYDASIAYNEYLKELSDSRSRVFITKEQISSKADELFSGSGDYHDARFDTAATYLVVIEGMKKGYIPAGFFSSKLKK